MNTEVPSPINTGWKGIDAIGSAGGRVGLAGLGNYGSSTSTTRRSRPARSRVMVRTEAPWTIAVGYLGMPQESPRMAQWLVPYRRRFPSGHRGRFYFVDRIKDAIRRRW